MSRTVLGWWFSNSDMRLGYGDGRLCEDGVTHRVSCKPILCEQGLHAATSIRDALMYAAGPVIWRVALIGTVLHGNDKMVAGQRRYLWHVDGEELLRRFSRMCALDVIDLWDAPAVVVRYLQTGDDSLRQAAYEASAWDNAWARASASALARASAWDRDSTWDRASAWDRARASASASQRRRLTSMVVAAHRKGDGDGERGE